MRLFIWSAAGVAVVAPSLGRARELIRSRFLRCDPAAWPDFECGTDATAERLFVFPPEALPSDGEYTEAELWTLGL